MLKWFVINANKTLRHNERLWNTSLSPLCGPGWLSWVLKLVSSLHSSPHSCLNLNSWSLVKWSGDKNMPAKCFYAKYLLWKIIEHSYKVHTAIIITLWGLTLSLNTLPCNPGIYIINKMNLKFTFIFLSRWGENLKCTVAPCLKWKKKTVPIYPFSNSFIPYTCLLQLDLTLSWVWYQKVENLRGKGLGSFLIRE